jgi:hypothetical protein
MYEGPKRQQNRGGLSTTNIHKIVISNLDFGITSTDIQVGIKILGIFQLMSFYHLLMFVLHKC